MKALDFGGDRPVAAGRTAARHRCRADLLRRRVLHHCAGTVHRLRDAEGGRSSLVCSRSKNSLAGQRRLLKRMPNRPRAQRRASEPSAWGGFRSPLDPGRFSICLLGMIARCASAQTRGPQHAHAASTNFSCSPVTIFTRHVRPQPRRQVICSVRRDRLSTKRKHPCRSRSTPTTTSREATS
jgi:hypothetical protein